MKGKNRSMNAFATASIAVMAQAVFFLTGSEAFAARPQPCPQDLFLSDDVYDLTKVHELQMKYYAENDPATGDAKYDCRRKIDRQQFKNTDVLYSLNAIGKVTLPSPKEEQLGFVESVKDQENRSWGTGFTISPCHMITNNHVICDREIVNGKSICKKMKIL